MFLAADDAAKIPVVLDLVAKLGFQAVDAGPLKIRPFLEPLAMLWIDQMLNGRRVTTIPPSPLSVIPASTQLHNSFQIEEFCREIGYRHAF